MERRVQMQLLNCWDVVMLGCCGRPCWGCEEGEVTLGREQWGSSLCTLPWRVNPVATRKILGSDYPRPSMACSRSSVFHTHKLQPDTCNCSSSVPEMAPSRGSGVLHLSRRSLSTLALRPGVCASSGSRRGFASFTDKLSDPANKLQSYVSTSNDPFLNLSIEHHILQKSPPDSTVLFLYVNRPCVVIGRNQNPWTEVNLAMLNAPPPTSLSANAVDLVRRRSGGGTVFHDHGNLNWSITCPRNHFTRDKHAEMVVRALRKLGVSRARVNERHDIVLDQGHEQQPSDPDDTHRTPYTLHPDALPRALKVSGSAYKLTRLRALHHATTLLSSPNLAIIPQYLHSPAKAFIQAKGVESVSSPVANIGLQVVPFQRHLQAEFAQMYAQGRQPDVVATVGDDHLQVPDIRKGYDELRVCT